jgi:hypothetical protein
MRIIALLCILFASCTYRYENCTIQCSGKECENASKVEALPTVEGVQSDESHEVPADSTFIEHY